MKLLVIAALILACALAVYFLVKAIKVALDKDKILESKSEKIVTDQMVALGADELPQGAEYVFVPDYKHGQHFEAGDVVQVRFKDKMWWNYVQLDHWNSKDKSVESLLLVAAQRSKNEFDPYYEKYLRQQRLRSIVEGTAMLSLSEPTEWKEDKDV